LKDILLRVTLPSKVHERGLDYRPATNRKKTLETGSSEKETVLATTAGAPFGDENLETVETVRR
jgi:hypothetical protein